AYTGHLEFSLDKEYLQAELIDLIDDFDALDEKKADLITTFCPNTQVNPSKGSSGISTAPSKLDPQHRETNVIPKWTKLGDFEQVQYPNQLRNDNNTQAKKEVTYKNSNIKTIIKTVYFTTSLDSDK